MTTDVYETPRADLTKDSAEIVPLSLAQLLFSFQGRIRRKAYWLASLGIIIAYIALAGILQAVGLSESVLTLVLGVLYIPVVWISLAVQAKRWHDRNKSAWWILINFVPVIGSIWALIENGFLAGDESSNSFGAPSA